MFIRKNFQKDQREKHICNTITSPAGDPTVIIFIQSLHILLLCFYDGGMWMPLPGCSLASL